MIYPNPRHLRAFVLLAEFGSFSAAAAQMHMGQPALSQAVAKLEEIVGVRLLERSTRNVRLTRAGEEFLKDANRVLGELGLLLTHGTEWAKASRGYLLLLTVPSVAHQILFPIVLEFGAHYPNVQIAVNDYVDPILRERMAQGEGDLALCTDPGTREHGPFLPLVKDEFCVVLPAQHPLAELDSIDMRQLAKEQLVLQRRGALLRSYVDPALARLRLKHQPIEVNQTLTLLGMVEAGLGVSLLPSLVAPSLFLKSIVTRPLSNPMISRTIGFVRSRERVAMPSLQAFVNVALQYVKENAHVLPAGVHPVQNSAPALAGFFSQ